MQTLIHISAGLLGAIFMMLWRMRLLQNKFAQANQEFVFRKFLRDDSTSIALSVTSVLMFTIIVPEIIHYKPELEHWVRAMFTLSGAIGDWAFAMFFGRTKKYIKGRIEEMDKTDSE